MKIQYIPYRTLVDELNGDKPSYSELLQTVEWRNTRQIILDRDRNKCCTCQATATEFIRGTHWRNFSQEEITQAKLLNDLKNELREPDFVSNGRPIKLKLATPLGEHVEKPIYLHVHHTFYVLSNLPWEYDLSSLVTLCDNCHQEVHSTIQIPCYKDKLKLEKLNLSVCKRCQGLGYLSQYKHVQHGVCFECHGAKYLELIGQYRPER